MIQNSVPINGAKLMMPKVVISRGPCPSPNRVMFLAMMRECARVASANGSMTKSESFSISTRE